MSDEFVQVVELLTDISVPLAVVLMGYIVNKTLENLKAKQARKESLFSKRLEIYGLMAEKLNCIFCFIQDRGEYERYIPKDVIEYKRECDRLMHTFRAIWSKDLFYSYLKYMESAFEMFVGCGKDPLVITVSSEKKKAAETRNGRWSEEFENQIKGEVHPEHKARYERLVDFFIRDLQFDIETSV